MHNQGQFAETMSVRRFSFAALVSATLVSASIMMAGCRAPLGPANKIRAAYAPGAERELKGIGGQEDTPFSPSQLAALEKGTAQIRDYTARMESGVNSMPQASVPSAPSVPAAVTYAAPAQPAGHGTSGALVGIGAPSRALPEIGSRQEPVDPRPELPRAAPGRDPVIGL